MAFRIPVGIREKSLTTERSPSRILVFPSRTRSSMSTILETDKNTSCCWKRSLPTEERMLPVCLKGDRSSVFRRIAEGLWDMKIFWRSSRIRKTRNMRHGRSGFPRTSTRNILISTESTFVCLREKGPCSLLLGRDGKRQYERAERSYNQNNQEKPFPKGFILNI